MMTTTKYIALLLGFQLISFSLTAQMMDDTNGTKSFKPEFRRLINHEGIDREQKTILSADGKTDDQFVVSTNEEINMMLTNVLINSVDEFQEKTETDSLLDHRLKVNYLTGLSNMLRYIRLNFRSKKVNILHLATIIKVYEKSIQEDKSGKSIETVLKPFSYDIGTTILASGIFDRNIGFKSAKDLMILKYCLLRPAETFLTLKNNPDVPFADSLIKAVARKYPGQLYNYAQAGNK
ncbi:MAG TPA: hypothetical protein VJ111_02995, partial [Chitinophagaceae bacterium]|nr:hypothetical protein [Chitinophagaceae bacterium]